MLRPILAAMLAAGTAVAPAAAAQPARPAVQRDNPLIDYGGFRQLAARVQPYRQTRLIAWAEFDHLPLPDFTAESLARLIGADRNRPILIYCNNNFSNNRVPVITKLRPLALNIQTFINLVGYGYPNVRELNDVIDFNDPRVRWVRG